MVAVDKTESYCMSATQLIDLYKAKKLSPVEVTDEVLDRITAVNDMVNAFVKVDGEKAIEEARASEKRWVAGEPSGLLDGVPITIKDLLITK
ncbi:MAG: amidase, partial [Magnetovibrio sp.]|nr:amidase [Magnetovibrio sp.]